MVRSEARIMTDGSSRYLRQLCEQFADRVPVAHAAGRGHITFAFGACRLEARDGVLTMAVEAEDQAGLAKLEAMLARHVEQLASGGRPQIHWVGLEDLKF